MASVLGKDFKAYYNTGTFGTPVWTELTNISGLKTNMDIQQVSARTRASGAYMQSAATGLDFSISWKMLWNLADTGFMALHAAAIALTEKDMIFLDGSATSGSHQGPRISANFGKFSRDEDENNISFVDVECKGGYAFAPSWFTGAV